jgi:hypothetical protein
MVVSLAMITILLTATKLFRAGEYGRASTDEAVAALGTLDDDLKRMVPARDGGFFYAAMYPNDTAATPPRPPNGNCVVAFTINQPTIEAVSSNGSPARLVVAYWVDTVTNADGTTEDVLYRGVMPTYQDLNDPTIKSNLDVVGKLFQSQPPAVARRCLHFGVWLSCEEQPRTDIGDWEQTYSDITAATKQPAAPNATRIFCTEPGVGGAANPNQQPDPDPFPTAVRFTLALAAGRYGPNGFVIDDNGTDHIRVTGLPSVPLTPGSMARIEDEWVRYSDYQGGALVVDTTATPANRGAVRSTAKQHQRQTPVRLGQLYSLARIFPH